MIPKCQRSDSEDGVYFALDDASLNIPLAMDKDAPDQSKCHDTTKINCTIIQNNKR